VQVYEQLKAIARARMAGERSSHTLQATALVHEAYLRMNQPGNIDVADRSRFFRAAAVAMREILIDHARGVGRQKRGGGAKRLNVDVLDLAAENDTEQILALDEAICRLQAVSPEAAEVVRLRFYAGLSIEETADSLNTSHRSVNRLWSYARAWLWRELSHSE
jgi:RNA polymerase sigma factor (TIGR02999 family)